ncbi:MAG: LD-carboxypeptidase [Parvularculaceae bacterium]|nr:LD-carboxypeptidase [Parvularculaceae bacterium]
MAKAEISIAVVAPANRLAEEAAAKVTAIARSCYGDRLNLYFHPQCFLSSGHFAGTDAQRSAAFLEAANDPAFSAVWFARGGYGSPRLEDAVFGKLNRAAHTKDYLGYSDLGAILGRLSREGVGRSVHGPMPTDIDREGGEAAVRRALAWLVDKDADAVEPSWRVNQRVFAFNLTVLSHLLAGPAEPDFTDAILMIEDIDEPHYRIDRAFAHLMSSQNVRRLRGVRLGRFSRIPPNDPPFEFNVREIAEYWCARARVAFLGEADIGHDAANKVVPFPKLSLVTA